MLHASNLGLIQSRMQGQGLGRFEDISQLTMFADYRVPVVLRQMGILVYSDQLAHKVRPPNLPL